MKNREKSRNNVVSLSDKLEKWVESYNSPCNHLQIQMSNHGRIKFCFYDGNKTNIVILEFTEGVSMLTQMLKKANESMKFN